MSHSGNMSRGLLDAAKITGPGSASAKYDVLTALLVLATQGEGVEARLALRLSLLITARYNWRRGSFAVGQKELGRMWGVTERTVKREMAELRGRGWIAVDVPAARGRVASYRIEFDCVLRATEPFWEAVGTDFANRLEQDQSKANSTNVVQLSEIKSHTIVFESGFWGNVCQLLYKKDPSCYRAWFAKLHFVKLQTGTLLLNAPTSFLANYVRCHLLEDLIVAAREIDDSVLTAEILSPS